MKRVFMSVAFTILTIAFVAETTDETITKLQEEIRQLQTTINEQQKKIEELASAIAKLNAAKGDEKPKKNAETTTISVKSGWKISLSGLAFLQFSEDLQNSQRDKNSFDITRSYINIEGKMDRWSFKITPDIYTTADGLAMRLKYAFLDFENPYPDSTLRFGLAPTPYVGYVENIYGYRYEGPIFVDREGYVATTDYGIYLFGKGGPTLSYYFGYANGESFSKREENRYKDVEGRVSITPFDKSDNLLKGLSLTLFGSYGKYSENETRQRWVGTIGFDHSPMHFSTEYLWAKDPGSTRTKREPSIPDLPDYYAYGYGYSIWGRIDLPRRFGILLRMDSLDPDRHIVDNSHRRYIGGLSYDFNKNISALLAEDFVHYDSGALLDDHRITGTYFKLTF